MTRGPAAGRDVRLQLQQLRRDLPAHRGRPFSADNPTAGGTDILISYTIRLAFGAGGAQIGFASAVSVVLFVITGVIAALQFRATRSLEDVN